MARLHKVLAVARLEESREPLFVLTTDLKEQGYVVESSYVRFEGEKDEPKIMGDRTLSDDMPVEEYDGVVFLDDGGDIKISTRLAKSFDKAKKVVAGWYNGCLPLAKAGLLKDKFVCKGLPKGSFDQSKVVNSPSVRADNIITSVEPTVDGFVVLIVDALGGKIKRTIVSEKSAFPSKSVLVVSKLPFWAEYWGLAERLAKDNTSVIVADWDDLDLQRRTIKTCLVLDAGGGGARLAAEGQIPKNIWFKQTSMGVKEAVKAVSALEAVGCLNVNSSEAMSKASDKRLLVDILSPLCGQGCAATYAADNMEGALKRLAAGHGRYWVRAAVSSPGAAAMSVFTGKSRMLVSSPGSSRHEIVKPERLARILAERFGESGLIVQDDMGSLRFRGKEFRLAFLMRRKAGGWVPSYEAARLSERTVCPPKTVLAALFRNWEGKMSEARELALAACVLFQSVLDNPDGVRELGVEVAMDRAGAPSVVGMSSVPDLTVRDAAVYGSDVSAAMAIASDMDPADADQSDTRADIADVIPCPGQDEHLLLLEREMAREGMWIQPDGNVAVKGREDFDILDLEGLQERLRQEAIEACRREISSRDGRNSVLARRARHRLRLVCQMHKWLGITKSASLYPSSVSGPFAHLDLPMNSRVFEFREEEDYLRDKDKSISEQPRYNPEYEKSGDPSDDFGFYFIWNEPRRSPEEWTRSLESEGVYITRKELRH